MKALASLAAALFIALPAAAQSLHLESDSLKAIEARTRADFPYTLDQARKAVGKVSNRQWRRAIDDGAVETMMIDDTLRVHRKVARNIRLLSDALGSRDWQGRGSKASDLRKAYVDSIMAESRGSGEPVMKRRVTYRFNIDVPTQGDVRPADTVRVWMPYPIESRRQSRVILRGFSGADTAIISGPDRSVHNTIYMAAPAAPDTTRFSYEASFDVAAQYFAPEFLEAAIRPYRTDSELYRRYTAFDSPHVICLDSLAKAIVGSETNPYRQSELVYDFINANYPWAGAREYSTIPSIPAYVIETGHGDCGQVALLYISLMRSLGVPARWESGWMLHPGEKNLHDWAEVYFQNVGWVPVDLSFGRYGRVADGDFSPAQKFYSTGIDGYRLAANLGVNGPFFPPKRFVRSETVDSQLGEVETSAGNLFYPLWDQHLEILSIEDFTDSIWARPRISVASMRVEPSHGAELASQAVMGMPLRVIDSTGEWWEVMTPDGYTGFVNSSGLVPMSQAEMDAWRRSTDRLVVTSLDQIKATATPGSTSPRDIVTDLVNGSIVAGSLIPGREFTEITLPDGRKGWVESRCLTPIDEWAAQPYDVQKILDLAYSMEGAPYLWGGTSTKTLDCSGLVKVSHLSNGLILRRDASQQALTGTWLDPADWRSYLPGDLLFFGNPATGRVTHVAIYDHDGNYVHSSGRVKRNSLDPQSPDYLPTPFLHAVRINGNQGSFGITRAADHPWYFDK